ncbi:uncharacterized protein J3R85_001915 [Psidium guajava]|nr:uncharacterized protein J3R85_001915 [Psidium guajava]
MKASLFRVNSVPGHHSMLSASPGLRPSRPNSDASAFSSSKIAARISLRHANGRREGGSCSRGSVPRAPIDDHYREMLESSPNCSLLLRNYAKYLHEVERDAERAEEYYARAILASPGDGEVLSLYGRLVWEAERDGDRARLYFDQAVNASPDDCTVLGSYARFLWEAGEEKEETV